MGCKALPRALNRQATSGVVFVAAPATEHRCRPNRGFGPAAGRQVLPHKIRDAGLAIAADNPPSYLPNQEKSAYRFCMGTGEKKRFESPIAVELKGKKYQVIDVADAGDLLLTNWPANTARRRKAMLAVMVALRGQGDIAQARKAFINAAVEVFALRDVEIARDASAEWSVDRMLRAQR